ncbi:MAG: prephenate dehydrogenase/arogenate dehydrogenase family protein [bacterium]|nr:prephenate dehydrogenase/arogenate dehydrogenase family protein [bacterium]
MAEVSVTILGLGRVGTSMGLALKRHNQTGSTHTFKVTGYDSGPVRAKSAQALKAVDDISNQPENAARGRDIVVIATPFGETKNIYDYITSSLRPGAVVLDATIHNQSALAWGKKYLPAGAHQVCIRPMVNPKYLFEGVDETERASADFFDNGTMLLMPAVNCSGEAVELAADFGRILGARPHYLDPAEHDGLAAAMETLPALLGTAYFYQAIKNPGWVDAQRVTNPAFGMLTHHLFDTHPDDLRDVLLTMSGDVVRSLDETITALRSLRNVLAQKDQAALEAVLEEASKEYEGWINRRTNNRWQDDDKLDAKAPGFGEVVGGMFGGFLTRRKKDDEK